VHYRIEIKKTNKIRLKIVQYFYIIILKLFVQQCKENGSFWSQVDRKPARTQVVYIWTKNLSEHFRAIVAQSFSCFRYVVKTDCSIRRQGAL
jgi:hypothetical protein